MKIIGILNTLKKEKENEPYDQYYKFTKLYIDRIKELNCLPVGILDTSDLSLYDAIIIPGGNMIKEEHYQVIDYCIKNNVPCLGICMGMQAMILYDVLINICKKEKERVFMKDLVNKYEELAKQKNYILQKVVDHGGELVEGRLEATLDNILKSKHAIDIKPNSFLDEIYHSSNIDVISMHNYGYKGDLKDFKVIATTKDNTVEAIQHVSAHIWGVQFHIEVEPNNEIIKQFINMIN